MFFSVFGFSVLCLGILFISISVELLIVRYVCVSWLFGIVR